MEKTTIQLETDFIPLAGLLKLVGIVGTGGEAKLLVQSGDVLLNDAVETRRGAKVRPGDIVVLQGEPTIQITVARSEP